MTTDYHSYADISECGQYRYSLGRRWHPSSPCAFFVMLNPSTADASADDPTIRRCIGFSKALGCGAIHVVNLYAYRATKPADLWMSLDPVGPENDFYLASISMLASREGFPLIAAWGANARPDRVQDVCALPGMQSLTALGETKTGAPRHPLYLRADCRPAPWSISTQEKVVS